MSGSVRIPPSASRLLKPLAVEARARGLPLYAVGGCVRDWLLKRPTLDLDLAVVGDPDPIAELCARLLGGKSESFGRFGTRRVSGKGSWRVDVAATRAESYPEPAGLPIIDRTGVDIEVDLKRRDFTVNAMAVRLDQEDARIVDPHDGRRDLPRRVIRALHRDSFRDDPTRAFRAARFLGRFGGRATPELVDDARAAVENGHAARLSRARILHELTRILEERDPRPALRYLDRWGYSGLIFPGISWPGRWPTVAPLRLATLAVSLGAARGAEFVDSLPVDHHLRVQLHEAVALAFSTLSPRVAPSALARRAVVFAGPRLPPAALKPCFVTGRDLIALGGKPGPSFHALLDEAAKLQRAGDLRTRAAARAWLKTRLLA